jgi:hypothetical protein
MGELAIHAEKAPTSTFAQWYGVLAAPVAWAVALQANYALSQYACKTGEVKWIAVSTLIFFLAAASGSVQGWRDYTKGKRALKDRKEAVGNRTVFMGQMAVMSGGLFATIIASHGIALIFFNPCVQ